MTSEALTQFKWRFTNVVIGWLEVFSCLRSTAACAAAAAHVVQRRWLRRRVVWSSLSWQHRSASSATVQRQLSEARPHQC